jgi:hypothetical protein
LPDPVQSVPGAEVPATSMRQYWQMASFDVYLLLDPAQAR